MFVVSLGLKLLLFQNLSNTMAPAQTRVDQEGRRLERQLQLMDQVHRQSKGVKDFHRGQATRYRDLIEKALESQELARVATVGK